MTRSTREKKKNDVIEYQEGDDENRYFGSPWNHLDEFQSIL